MLKKSIFILILCLFCNQNIFAKEKNKNINNNVNSNVNENNNVSNPRKNDQWFIKFKNQEELEKYYIVSITDKVIQISKDDEYSSKRLNSTKTYKKDSIELVERTYSVIYSDKY